MPPFRQWADAANLLKGRSHYKVDLHVGGKNLRDSSKKALFWNAPGLRSFRIGFYLYQRLDLLQFYYTC
jgi:hypothetical protein